MATRSIIAMSTDSDFISVYCHWDGYLSHVGQTLLDHYATEDKVKELIGLGDISSLGPEIGTTHDSAYPHYYVYKRRLGCASDYDNFDFPPHGQTNYYGRDRGEPWENIQPQHHSSMAEFLGMAQASGAEYLYVFNLEHQTWLYAARGMQFFGVSDGSEFSTFQPLTQDAINQE